MGAAITYLLLLGVAFGTAMGLFFGLRAAKLI
ncbi:cytochrome b6-f complex subunit PetL [Almyronema epifaneia]|uniref:Cytochrome b6-f complex subunit 6 n=1 Tax=Almyronema epifaneia S1 TaxID=2991925 RepID=A0ABW6IAR1_9CYAN